ncbi:MAG: phosphotransferase [Acidimicrobiales bacterium]
MTHDVAGVLDAVARFAAGHGVRAEAPVVMSHSSNIVVHLAPAPVVARIANVTAAGRDRPDRSLARELALTAHLASLHIPTTAPSAELPPGPHEIGGRWVSFIEHVSLAPVVDDDAARAGDALADVIEAMATFQDPDGLFDRSLADEADVVLARLEGRIDEGDRQLLLEWRDEAFLPAAEDAQPVHADPHRRNIGRRADGELVWFDFDDAVCDSRLVDVATLFRSWPAAGMVAGERLGIDVDGAAVAEHVEQREAWGGIWGQMFVLELGDEHAAYAAAALARRRR